MVAPVVIELAALLRIVVRVALFARLTVAPPNICPTKLLNTFALAALSLPAEELKALVPLIKTLATLAAAACTATLLFAIGS